MPSDAFRALRDHLEQMFQFDENDLDFGIYRILKLKRHEVERFLDSELQAIAQKVLGEIRKESVTRQQAALRRVVLEEAPLKYHAMLEDLETHRDDLRRFLELQEPEDKDNLLAVLEAGANGTARAEELETRLYNHVLHFFQRYYRDGDFGYDDRSGNAYEVDYPNHADYDGSDVLFHWKHKDSYYIKSSYGFHSVSFTVEDAQGREVRITYRVEGDAEGAGGVAQNNNKDARKHYALDRVEPAPGEEEGYHVVFHLAERSTPKAEVFQAMHEAIFADEGEASRAPLPAYLYDDKDKPLFTDLEGDFDEVQGGSVKGTKGNKTLRTSKEKYVEALVKAHREHFEDIATSNPKRTAALLANEALDPWAHRFYLFDKNLNTFYIGQESDYFVHKDLGRFLTREKERYVKNVFFANLDALLLAASDDTALVLARAFSQVVDRLIAFLDAVETFQKNLFLLKKKVLQTDYLVSLGTLEEHATTDELQALMERVGDCDAQKQAWAETFEVKPLADPMQYVGLHPTLPLDTRHFDARFKDDLLAIFDDLEEATDGLLLCSENLQALRLLERSFREQVKCIYIDPPYNTSSSAILYKNHFKHSSWLSLMENRVSSGLSLLARDGVHVTAIDENEQERLGLMLRDLLPEHQHTCVTIVHNPSGQQGDNFSYCHDYSYFCYPLGGQYIGEETRDDDADIRNFRDVTGDSSLREAGANCFYPVLVRNGSIVGFGDVCDPDFHPGTPNLERKDGTIEVYPIDPQGIERKWRFARQTVDRIKGELFAHANRQRDVWDIKRAKDKFNFKTVWTGSKYSANNHGTQVLNQIIGKGHFTFPKSIHTVTDSLDAALNNEQVGLVFDYFAGSGTTGHAVMKLNAEDGGQRKFMLVEMGAYFDRVLLERIRRVMYSFTWKDGRPRLGEDGGYQGFVKYQWLEQYEDVLNQLQPEREREREREREAGPVADGSVPLRYLYRPEAQRVRQTLDLGRPFSNTAKAGKEEQTYTLDLLETYAYLRGYRAQQQRRFDLGGRTYRALKSGRHLVVFRDIDAGDDDAEHLLTVLDAFEGVEVLEVNHDADQRKLDRAGLSVRLVGPDAFDQGATWA